MSTHISMGGLLPRTERPITPDVAAMTGDEDSGTGTYITSGDNCNGKKQKQSCLYVCIVEVLVLKVL